MMRPARSRASGGECHPCLITVLSNVSSLCHFVQSRRRSRKIVHVLDDTGDVVRYELCHSHHDDEDDDLHVHFYCEKCHRTYCLEDIPVPPVTVPGGYDVHSVNYLIRGVCPGCR